MRDIVLNGLAVVIAAMFVIAAQAQIYLTKPNRIIFPYTAGGLSDLVPSASPKH